MLNAIVRQGRSSLLVKITTGAFLTGIADLLFFRHGLGWTAGLYGLLLLITVSIFHPQALRTALGKMVLILSLGLCFSLANEPSLLAGILLATGILFFLGLHVWRVADPFVHVQRLAAFLTFFPVGFPRDCAAFYRVCRARRGGGLKAQAVWGWLIIATFIAVFAVLFTIANPVIENWWNQVTVSPGQLFSAERVLFWTICLLLLWGMLRPPRRHLHAISPARDGSPVPAQQVLFSETAVLRSLVVFNAMFLAQNILDAVYLWGGKQLPTGLTYADYAHRGAYPLMATALLAAVFVLLALRPHNRFRRPKQVNALIYIWLLQNIVLVLSSIWRTKLYVDVYSLTYLRYAALLWMGLVMAGLGLIILRIVLAKSNIWLINANLAALFVVLYVNCFFDAGRFIAFHNVRHCKEVTGTGIELDYAYLQNIGISALPALQWLRQHNQQGIETAGWLERDLHNKLVISLDNWRTWTIRNYRLSREIEAGSTSLPSSSSASRFETGGASGADCKWLPTGFCLQMRTSAEPPSVSD